MKEKIENDLIQEFESKIKEYEDILFGMNLYYQGVVLTWKSIPLIGKIIANSNYKSYKNIEKRMTVAIQHARQLLKRVEQSSEDPSSLQRFKFPPIMGLGLSQQTKIVKALAETYKQEFPGRPKNKPLTKEESKILKIITSTKI